MKEVIVVAREDYPGEKRLVAWNNTVLKDKNGEITGTISSGEDITERRQAEQLQPKQKKYF